MAQPGGIRDNVSSVGLSKHKRHWGNLFSASSMGPNECFVPSCIIRQFLLWVFLKPIFLNLFAKAAFIQRLGWRELCCLPLMHGQRWEKDHIWGDLQVASSNGVEYLHAKEAGV